MAINTAWIPVIKEGVKWGLQQISKAIGPSKSELQLNIDDLEKQLSFLMKENKILATHIQVIESLIIQELTATYHCHFHNGMITPGEHTPSFPDNSSYLVDHAATTSQHRERPKDVLPDSTAMRKDAAHIFDNMDEEILQMRNMFPRKSD